MPNDTASDRMSRTMVRPFDTRGLEEELGLRIRGEVRFDDGSRALYATDASNYRQVPIGVVIPRTAEDVVETVAVCRARGVPILARGGGTSLAGQCCNVAVVLDFSKYLNRVLEIDPERRIARIQPGIVLDDLRAAARKHGLTFGPDPATHNHCTLGGMIGNNSCGVHSVMAGRTCDNVHELEVLTYEGERLRVGPASDAELEEVIRAGGRKAEIYSKLKDLRDRYADRIRERYPKIPRRVSGYALDELLPENGFNVARALVGSECTCVLVLEATVRLVEDPAVRSLLVLGYPDVFSAGDHVPEVRESGPIGLEGMDDRLVRDMKVKKLHPHDVELLPPGRGWLLVEFGGRDKQESDGKARALMDRLKGRENAPSMKLFDDPEQEHIIWKVRESGLGATAFVPGRPDTWEGWEDSAVPPEKVGEYLRELRKLFDRYEYACDLYGHFGDGCVHTRIDFDLLTAEGIRKYRAFIDDAADLVVRMGGSFSGEHGDGQSRGVLLPKMFGEDLVRAFEEFKSIWDPRWKMNPGKVVRPYRPDQNLRLGVDYNPPHLETHFRFPADGGDFARAALRCVGVGECRKTGSGTMCPSYMATREEMHSTRGRTHLLFEMLQGQELQGGWKDDHVKEALDLCLACKGCKGECPVNVDMATYKAEFLSHYYAGRLRPRSGYAMGLIHWWARLASLAPGLVNALGSFAPTAAALKAIGGIAPRRSMPKFARQTFKSWFRSRGPAKRGGPRVMLWPDTFTDHFFPEAGKAAVEVLEALGWSVVVPQADLCCGRPLYDYGMLDLAKELLGKILSDLREPIRQGMPLVGLEPSCLSVFRDEANELFPHDQDAQRLRRNAQTLAEFIQTRHPDHPWPKLSGPALLHGHCHQKAVLSWKPDQELLGKLGLDYRALDAGCCGMAGSFGFEKDKYGISVEIGERVLLPAVRKAGRESLIVADGFSCREQIAQCTDRKGVHLAQVLQQALRESRAPREREAAGRRV